MGTKTVSKVESDNIMPPKKAVLFELDNISIDGQDVIYGVLNRIMGSKGITFSHAMYVRYCLDVAAKKYVPAILAACDKKRVLEDKLVAEIEQAVKKAVLEKNHKARPFFGKLLDFVQAENMEIGAVSGFDMATCLQLVEKLGISLDEKRIVSYYGRGLGAPGAEVWLKLAKTLAIPGGRCIAVASGGLSCRGVMATGMNCVVVPNRFSDFQDFSGVDYVVRESDDVAIKDMLKSFLLQ